MGKTFKKILCTLLVVVMCLTSAPLQGFVGMKWPSLPEINFGEFELPKIDFSSWFSSKAEAAEIIDSGNCGDDVIWILYDNGELVISGNGPMENYFSSSSPFYNNSTIKSIIIENGVTQIGDNAFTYSRHIKSISIPNSVTRIGLNAFKWCGELSNIVLPDNLECISLSSVYGTEDYFDSSKWKNKVFYLGDYLISAEKTIEGSYTIQYGTKMIAENAFSGCEKLTEIVIPNSIQFIGEDAFSECTQLKSIDVPNSVVSIGDWAFFGCTNLVSVIIPDNISFVGEHTFNSCKNLRTITMPAGINSLFWNCESISEITITKGLNGVIKRCGAWSSSDSEDVDVNICDGVVAIDKLAFQVSSIGSVTIPKTLVNIGESAFYNCKYLKNVKIPNNVVSIGEGAFKGCPNLVSVVLSENLEVIKQTTFKDCLKLESITIPNSIKSIESHAFNNCTNLKKVYINDISNWCKIDFASNPLSFGGELYLNEEKIVDLVIPESVSSISDRAFAGSKGFKSLTILNSTAIIGYNAFENCTDLTKVTIPASALITGFEGCTSITDIFFTKGTGIMKNFSVTSDNTPWRASKNDSINIYLEYGITNIGNYAFYECAGIKNITIPNSVTSIGYEAFYKCINLTDITIPDSVTSIGSWAFYGCESIKRLSIPASLDVVNPKAFLGCSNLTDIIISKGTGTMFSYTYDTCQYTPWYISRDNDIKITVKYGVKNIGRYAFYDCKGLKNITIPNSVTNIDGYAFYNCSGLKKVILSNQLNIIDNHAFYGCSGIDNITIPNSVTETRYNSFSNCSNITDIYYNGTESQWNNIICINNSGLIRTNIIYHFEYDIPGGSSDDSSISSEKFKFSFESYSINTGRLLTDKGVVTLVYKSDEETIFNFNVDSINFEVSDNSIFRFKEAYIEPSNLDTMVKISCWVEGLKLGSATLTATLPDGTTASCEIEVTEEDNDIEEDEDDNNNQADTEAEKDAFIQQHLLFRDTHYEAYTKDLRWAAAIWDHMDTTSTEIAEFIYDVIDGVLEIVTLRFFDGLEIAANPYDVILLDFLASDMYKSQFVEAVEEDALTIAVEIVNDFIKLFDHELDWVGSFVLKDELKSLISTSDYSYNKLYLALSNLHSSEHSDKIMKVFKGFECSGKILKTLEAGLSFADLFVQMLRYTVAVEAFNNSTEVFKDTMTRIASEMENNNPDFAKELKKSLGFYEKSLTYDSIVEYVLTNKGIVGTGKIMYNLASGLLSKATTSFIMVAFDVTLAVAMKVNAVLWSADIGWGLSNLLTGNNVSMECRRLLRANYALDAATYDVLQIYGEELDKYQTYNTALYFDSAFSIFKMVQLYSLDQYKKYCENLGSRPIMVKRSEFKNADEYLTAASVMWKNINCHYVNDTNSFIVNNVDTLRVACPTDICVYRKSDNKLVASVINNKSTLHDDSVAILCVGDEKCFAAMDIDDYKIEITATDDGVMDVVYNKYVDFKNTDSFRFDNFKITQSTTYEVQNDQKSIKNEDNIVYSHDGKISGCSCKCHKSGIAKFFFKIGLFFQKIFKKNKVCKCGVYHY